MITVFRSSFFRFIVGNGDHVRFFVFSEKPELILYTCIDAVHRNSRYEISQGTADAAKRK